MTRRPISAPVGLDALREELGIPADWTDPPPVAERDLGPREDALGVPFVTIDPPGARDLDQALHLERRGDGYRVRYAIADVAAFVEPGSALDAQVWERGVTYYAPDRAIPLHPPAMSAGAASLLAGEERPAVLWTLDLAADGSLERVRVVRARVRSREQLDYAGVQARLDAGAAAEPLVLLAEVGALRQALERARGGVSLPIPQQEVTAEGEIAYRTTLPVEGFNAQISLLTGMAAADLVLSAGTGVLRTLPPASEKALARLRLSAEALGVPWPRDVPYPDFIRSLDPARPHHAAVLHEATGVLRGAGYAAFDGSPPEQARHAALAEEYAHVTAPLRRLADRYALECALAACAGADPPAWVRERLDELPGAMAAADRRAGALERAAVDLAEALVLQDRVGETFDAVVVDDGLVMLRDPAIRARCDGDPPVGASVRATLVEADPASREVRFRT